MRKTITPQLTAIQKRFFDALDVLISTGQVNGLKGFCEESGMNRCKYSKIRSSINKPESGANDDAQTSNYRFIDIEAVAYLCENFRVNAEWLLLGRGKMFKGTIYTTNRKITPPCA